MKAPGSGSPHAVSQQAHRIPQETGKPYKFPQERLKLVYSDQNSGAGRVEWLDDCGRVTKALDMSLLIASLPCFTAETAVATKSGPVLASALRPGDHVITRDHGACQLAWVGTVTFDWRCLGVNPLLRPIRIRAGALGNGLPERDLMVSPNHRILVNARHDSAGGGGEALIAARELVGQPGISPSAVSSVSYFQFLLARHEIILADGCWSESYLLEKTSMEWMGSENLKRLGQIFPDILRGVLPEVAAARPAIGKAEVSSLIF